MIFVKLVEINGTKPGRHCWDVAKDLNSAVGLFQREKYNSKFLNMDTISTALMLGKIDNSESNRQIIRTDIYKKIKELDEKISEGETIDWSAYPLFTSIKGHVETVEKGGRGAKQNPSNNQPTVTTNPTIKGKTSEVVVNAHAASESESESANAASTNTNTNTKFIYNGEILKSQGVMTKNKKGKSVPYIAVKKLSSICSNCYPTNGAPNPCTPIMCFGKDPCKRCDYHGHTSSQCKQSHGAGGQPITSN